MRTAIKSLVLLLLLPALSGSGSQTAGNEEWIQLFNGKDLTGWDIKISGHPLNENYKNTFRVSDGILRVCYDEYEQFDGEFGHLFYRQTFSDYILRVEYRFVGQQVPGGPEWARKNSGAMLHSQPAGSMGLDQDFPVSIEAQFLGGLGQGGRPTANLCTPGTNVVMNGELVTRHCTNSNSPTFHGEEWVTVEMIVHGGRDIYHIVQGDTVLAYSSPQIGGSDLSDDYPLPEGTILTGGYIALQAESHPVEFRKVELLDLSGSTQSEENSQVNPLNDFGITANNAFFYYNDIEGATEFYKGTLGLDLIADYGFARILRVAPTSYLTLVDGTMGMHTPEEPKTVAIALITDQLDEWYEYLGGQGVEMRFDYNPVEGRPHHGFVVLDPEGYYLEFERFNQHPENEKLIPLLERTETIYTQTGENTTVPPGLGFKATVLWMYYRDMEGIQDFYEEKLGLELTVDQGWARIYRTSPSGYIGPVDETRGMHSFTEQKAVTVSFLTDDLEGWFSYVKEHVAFELRHTEISVDGEGRFKAFVGYDPEGYFLEFDTFLPHELNVRLLESFIR